jgi:phage gp45-like
VFFSSCSKENLNPEEAANLEDVTNLEDFAIVGSSSFFEENFKNKIVVVAGGTIEEGAVVWINDKKVLLLNDALEATGLFYQDNKIYVTGWTYGGKGSVWVMDLDGSNQTVMELEGKYSEGQRIMVHNGDIYTGGYFDNGSCYWKNGSKIDLTKNADSMSWGIAMDSNNNLFNVGYYMSQHHSLIPAFWKNGKRNKLNRPQHGDGEAKYIKIIGNKKKSLVELPQRHTIF